MTYDAIIVLGNQLRPTGELGRTARSRVKQGVSLVREGRAPVLVVSGGHGYVGPALNVTEATKMKQYAQELGLPARSIIMEDQSRDTLGNGYYTHIMARRHDWRSVLLVTTDLHLRRAHYIFKHIFEPTIKVHVLAVSSPLPLSRQKKITSSERRNLLVVKGILKSRLLKLWCYLMSQHKGSKNYNNDRSK